MKTTKFLFPMLIFFLISAGCKHRPPGEKTVVSGKIRGLSNQKIYLQELDVSQTITIDSTESSAKGEFQFELNPEGTNFYVLDPDPFENIPFIAGEGQEITIHSDTADLHKHLKVDGSEESALLAEYLKHTRANENMADSLIDLMKERRMAFKYENIRESFGSIFDSIRLDQEAYAREFIRKHPGQLASILVLNQPFGQIPLFSQKDDLDYYLMLDSGLAESYPDNKHTIEHREFVAEIIRMKEEREKALSKLQPGKTMPDVSLPNPEGKKIPISSLRGKTVLVYFWAAWDARSRQANQRLVELYKRLKPKGFEVYAISFDKHQSTWEAAIKVDDLNWVNVSDLEHRASPVLGLYQIPDELPFFYLLDDDGKILYRGDNYSKLISLLNAQFGDH